MNDPPDHTAEFSAANLLSAGGITVANLPQYLALPNVAACGGSWMAKGSMISAGQFAEITRLSRQARAIVHQVRGEPEVNQ